MLVAGTDPVEAPGTILLIVAIGAIAAVGAYLAAASWRAAATAYAADVARLERLVRDERAKVADYVEDAPVGFYSIDEDGVFLYANQTLGRWLGVSPEQLVKGRLQIQAFVT